jgi:general secretion pathway protein H
LVFDLDGQIVTLEETASLNMARDKDDAESPAAGANPVTEMEREAEEDAQEVIEGPRAPLPQFTPVQEFKAQEEGEDAGRSLGKGVTFRFVQTEHDSEKRTEGRAYLYFWPGGETEHAVVHLGRQDSNGLSVRVSALTGRAKIEKGSIELPEARVDGEISEREEE